MAKKNETPVVQLSVTQKAQMEGLQSDIDRAERAIASLKEMNMDTKELEEKLEWAKNVRGVLLKDFA